MRISDWSSDVCSSDLRSRPDDVVGGAAVALAGIAAIAGTGAGTRGARAIGADPQLLAEMVVEAQMAARHIGQVGDNVPRAARRPPNERRQGKERGRAHV